MFDATEWAHVLEQSNLIFLLWFVPLFLAIYFIPTLLALIFNRRHLGKIAIANIPTGFSMLAWFALMGVAISGKLLASKQGAKNE
ncbi:superinfection immunity protein [Alkalimonas sp. NCh-2]|uniref:superinfection immunity protein n=1 Tax=Alkalimonas sp. NCh-2 TaxID=3144846 RepID=UPI0031F6F628